MPGGTGHYVTAPAINVLGHTTMSGLSFGGAAKSGLWCRPTIGASVWRFHGREERLISSAAVLVVQRPTNERYLAGSRVAVRQCVEHLNGMCNREHIYTLLNTNVGVEM